MYGENLFAGPGVLGSHGTWKDTGYVRAGNIMVIPFGGAITLRRNTNSKTGNVNTLYLADSQWDIAFQDDVKQNQKYIGSPKMGNLGVLIGGEGRGGQRGAPIHQTQAHGSAILQLDFGRGDEFTGEGPLNGSGSVFIPPRISQGQRNTLGNPVAGSIIYNSDTNKLQVRTNTAWVDLH